MTTRRRSSRRAQELTPNAPLNRLGFIRKTYEKQPWVAYDTLSVIFNTIGIDEPWRYLEDAVYVLTPARTADAARTARTTMLQMFFAGSMIPGLPDPRWSHGHSGYTTLLSIIWNLGPIKYHGEDDLRWDERANTIFEIVDEQQFAEGAMREPHEADSIFPWVARELSKLTKHTIAAIEESIKENLSLRDDFTDYTDALETLRRSTNLFAQWAKAKRVDIMKMSLSEVIEATKDFKYTGKIRQGKIVLRLADGWTVQELRGRRELAPEGKRLAHCVGTYVQKVDSGQHEIYSLRDPDGVPYVTMDWKLEGKGFFKQVFGKANSKIGDEVFSEYVFDAGQDNKPPLAQEDVGDVTEMIRSMVIEFIDKVKSGNVRGLILAGASLDGHDLTGEYLYGANLRGANLSKLSGAYLSSAYMANATLIGADLTDAILVHTNLSSANLSGANLTGANLTRANLTGANLRNARLNADLTGADLTSANLTGADLTDANLTGAHLSRANLTGASLSGVQAYANLSSTNMTGADLTNANLDGANLDDAVLIGAKYNNSTSWPADFDPVAAGAVKV